MGSKSCRRSGRSPRAISATKEPRPEIWLMKPLTLTSRLRHTASQRRLKAPEIRGSRTRQLCGFFAPRFPVYGREGDGYNTPQGERSPPDVSRAFNLPATLAGVCESAPARLIDSIRSASWGNLQPKAGKRLTFATSHKSYQTLSPNLKRCSALLMADLEKRCAIAVITPRQLLLVLR